MTRILYLPHTSSPDRLSTDHSYGWASNIFAKWIKADPNVSIYWPVPRGAIRKQREAFYKFSDEELKTRVKLIEVETDITQILEQSTFPKKLINLFTLDHGRYYFDILFCEKPALLGWFFNNCNLYKFRREEILTICNIHYALSSEDNIAIAKEFDATYYANLALADAYLFCNSEGTSVDSLKQVKTNMKRWLAPSLISKFLDKPRWMKLNSDIEELSTVYDEWDGTKGDGFRVHFGFSISNLFHFKDILSVLQKARYLIKDLKFIITTPSGSLGRGGAKTDDSWMEVYFQCPRPKFFQIALKSHVFVAWSVITGGLNHGGIIEMARLGVLPVLHRKSIPFPWDDSYPFIFETEEELIALLKYIKANYTSEHVQLQIKENQRLINEFNMKCGPSTLIQEFVALKDDRPHYPYNAFSAILPELPDRITMEELVHYVKHKSDLKKDLDEINFVTAFKTGTKADLRWYMLSHGWRDVGDTNNVIFEREG